MHVSQEIRYRPHNFGLMVRNGEKAVEIRAIIGRVSFGESELPVTPHLNQAIIDSAIAFARDRSGIIRDTSQGKETLYARMFLDHPVL